MTLEIIKIFEIKLIHDGKKPKKLLNSHPRKKPAVASAGIAE
jgi:hypothetical protein